MAMSIRILFSSAFRNSGIAHQLRDVILFFLVVASLVARMIHTQHSTKNCRTAEVVDCKVGAALVLVFEERKASTLASFLITNQVHMDRLSVLREYSHDVAF